MSKQKTIYIMLALSLCSLLSGCKTTPSKEGTALDHIKKDLKEAVALNKQLQYSITLPTFVENSLKPNIAIQKDYWNPQINTESRFNVIANAVPIQAFFMGLVEDTNFNVILSPKVTGTISVKLKNVNLMETLNTIQQAYGYGIDVDSNNIRISPAELQTKTFKLNYLDLTRGGSSETRINSSGLDNTTSNGTSSSSSVSNGTSNSSDSTSMNSKINTTSNINFWEKLETTLKTIIGTEDGRKVAVIPVTGMIIVQAMPNELIKVEQFLKQSELFLNRQVILEAKILEIELNDAYRAGINWSILSRHLNVSQISGNGVDSTSKDLTDNFPINNGTSTTTPTTIDASGHTPPNVATAATPFGGIFALGLNYNRLATFVELLGSQGNVQVLSSPKISTTNNQKALIKVGSDAFYVTDVTTTTTTTASGTTGTVSPSVKFDSFFSGIALDVTPQIEENGYVTLHVHPTISNVSNQNINLIFDDKKSTYPLAESTIRESDSIIRAKNGQFVVIGGLMQDKTGEIITGIPILKDIPFFGTIFRQTRQQAKKTELVILLRPLVMDENSWGNELEHYHEKFEKLDKGFHVGGNVDLYGTMAEK